MSVVSHAALVNQDVGEFLKNLSHSVDQVVQAEGQLASSEKDNVRAIGAAARARATMSIAGLDRCL
jgi:hypothetical protein